MNKFRLTFQQNLLKNREHPKQFLHRVIDTCALRITSDSPLKSFEFCNFQA